MKWHGGKGSAVRPVDKKKYDDNFERIFGKKDKSKETKVEENKNKQTQERKQKDEK
jgi:hypothetical protein